MSNELDVTSTLSVKRRRVSFDEMDTIKNNYESMSAKEIAAKIHRTPEWVESVLKNIDGYQEINDIRKRFRQRPEYIELKKQFDENELQIFENKYIKWVRQFKHDILPTEDSQIFMAITYELLFAKCMRIRKEVEDEIIQWSMRIEQLRDGIQDDPKAQQEVTRLNNLIVNHQALLTRKTSELGEYTDKWQKQMKELKATREQRIKNIENTKHTFIDLLKGFEDEIFRKAEGEEMELARISGDRELERLAIPHKYLDETIDQPVLSAETIEMMEKQETLDEEMGASG